MIQLEPRDRAEAVLLETSIAIERAGHHSQLCSSIPYGYLLFMSWGKNSDGSVNGPSFSLFGRNTSVFLVSPGGLIWKFRDDRDVSMICVNVLSELSDDYLGLLEQAIQEGQLQSIRDADFHLHFADTYIPCELRRIVQEIVSHNDENGRLPASIDEIRHRLPVMFLYRLRSVCELGLRDFNLNKEWKVYGHVRSLGKTFVMSHSGQSWVELLGR